MTVERFRIRMMFMAVLLIALTSAGLAWNSWAHNWYGIVFCIWCPPINVWTLWKCQRQLIAP